MSKEYDYIMKLILIKDASVGKTNILNKYLKNEYYKANLKKNRCIWSSFFL